MKKFKKVMTLLLVLSMVMMSGMSAFADGDVPPQDSSVPVSETENTVQPENQQLEETPIPSDKPEDISGNQDVQQTKDDTKDEIDSDDESTESTDAAGTEGTSGTEGEGENLPQSTLSTEENGQTQVATPLGTVTASVYLRYDNTVPTQILQSSAQAEYGPAGDSKHPYFTVEVNRDKIEELWRKETTKIKKYEGDYTYYSAQEFPNVPAAESDVRSCWNEILTAMSSEDQQKFAECFGAGPNGGSNFIGYVFKSEADGWHIDGILNVVPGYVTEFYLNGKIKKTHVDTREIPGPMEKVDAKAEIKTMLNADSITWENDMRGTYNKGKEIYRFTITEGDYSASEEYIKYVEKITAAYYLARIYVTTEKIGEKPTEFDVQAVYKVEHYWKTDSGYELHETERLHGKIDTEVVATAKDYSQNGYEVNETAEGTVKTGTVTLPTVEDGKVKLLTLKLYYDPVEPSPVTPQEAAYEVRYHLQQADGSYKMAESQFPLYGEIGATVTAPQKDFAGYVFNEEKSNASGEVVKFKLTREAGEPQHLVLNMYYDIASPQPPVEPVYPPYIPPTIDPVEPVDPVDPQPLPPDDPLIEEPDEPIGPQPLPPDDPLIEDEDSKQPLPEDEHLIDPTNAGKAGDPDQPKTGDEAPLMALTGLFLAAAGALGAICIKRKKEN